MFTAKALNKLIQDFLAALEENGFHVKKAILFGSYALGKPHKYSDIDLAIWLYNCPDEHYTEIPPLLHTVASHYPVHPKFYDSSETKETDPFIEIIQKTGKDILLPVKG